MTTDPLDHFYRELEKSCSVIDSPEYALLVVPNGNLALPVHRWFHLKEAYSSRLVARVLKDLNFGSNKELRVLDPYAGAGTTCVAAADLVADRELSRSTAYGVEANGFLQLVASSKLRALQDPPSGLPALVKKIRRAVLSRRATTPEPPTLSTFHVDAYFERPEIEQLMRLKLAIDSAEVAGADELEIALARVSLGGSVESVSNLRRDGRTLRYVEKPFRPTALQAFERLAEVISEDLPPRRVPISGRVIRGDGRRMSGLDRRIQPFNLVIYSPPYPNNIDYTEVYKLENWLLGFITNTEQFVQQRLRTVYSHPSVLRPDPLPTPLLDKAANAQLEALVEPLLAAVPLDRYAEGRRRMLRGYVVDMYLTLVSARQRLAAGGAIVYVVGNSVHGHGTGQFVIAADLLIAKLAQAAGLRVQRLCVARHLRRRFVSSPYLRESVVFLRHADM